MTRVWPAGVALMLLASLPCAAQDDEDRWEGHIQYTRYINIVSVQTKTRERTVGQAGATKRRTSSFEESDRHLDGKLSINVWMSGGRTTVAVTGKSVWSRTEDRRQRDENGGVTCEGEYQSFFSETAFRDDEADISVSLNDQNHFAIMGNGTAIANASADILDHAGNCAGWGHWKVPTQTKKLDQPWSVRISGVSKSRNAITLKSRTEAVPHGPDGRAAAEWFYELLDQFIPPLSERSLGTGTSAFTWEDVTVDLTRKNPKGYWTGTFTSNCDDSGGETITTPVPSDDPLFVGMTTDTRASTEKFSVKVDLPADGSMPVATVTYGNTLTVTQLSRKQFNCGAIGTVGPSTWKPYNSDSSTKTTIVASGPATPTASITVKGAQAIISVRVPPVHGTLNTTIKESFNGGCGDEPTSHTTDGDDDALSPPFEFWRGVYIDPATPDVSKGGFTDAWKKTDQYAALHNATCTYAWNLKYVKQERDR